MKFISTLAFKNLLRYKRRTIITAVAIAAGLALFIWIDSFMMGIELDAERNMRWYESGSAQIMAKKYFPELDYLPLKYNIPNPAEVLSLLEQEGIPATSRISFGGEIFFGEGSKQMKIIAIDNATNEKVFRLSEVLEKNSRFPEPGKNEILLGKKAAEYLGIKINDTIEIRARTRYGAAQTFEMEVVGLIYSPNPVINRNTGFIPLTAADEYLQMEGAVTEIPIIIEEWKNLKKELASLNVKLKKSYPDYELYKWDLLGGNMMLMSTKRQFIYIILFLVFVVAAVGIINTMLMAVFERIREIGMMRAMGMKDGSIRWAFLLEAAGIGLIGSVIGVILGAVLTFISVEWGMDYSAFIGDMDFGMRILAVFRGAWNPPTMVVAFIFGVIISALVSLYPAQKALNMEITECLRHQ